MRRALVLLAVVSCASTQAAPPPSLPAAQARERAAEWAVGSDSMEDDLNEVFDDGCALLRSLDASVPDGACQ